MESDNLSKARKKRGQVEESDLFHFRHCSDQELAVLLESQHPALRTTGAVLLGRRKSADYVEYLCGALQTETALYAKIAICEALIEIGEKSVCPLSTLLGSIGNNQERVLPNRYFRKKSYPLVRDIAARTLISIGNPAVPVMLNLKVSDNPYLLSQIIDTLGGLLNCTKDLRILTLLQTLYKQVQHDELLLWKTIRALSAIKNTETKELITDNLNSSTPPLVWETIRTLGLISDYDYKLINKLRDFISHSNKQISEAARDAVTRINWQEV